MVNHTGVTCVNIWTCIKWVNISVEHLSALKLVNILWKNITLVSNLVNILVDLPTGIKLVNILMEQSTGTKSLVISVDLNILYAAIGISVWVTDWLAGLKETTKALFFRRTQGGVTQRNLFLLSIEVSKLHDCKTYAPAMGLFHRANKVIRQTFQDALLLQNLLNMNYFHTCTSRFVIQNSCQVLFKPMQ